MLLRWDCFARYVCCASLPRPGIGAHELPPSRSSEDSMQRAAFSSRKETRDEPQRITLLRVRVTGDSK